MGLVGELGELPWWALAPVGKHMSQGWVLAQAELLHLSGMWVDFIVDGQGRVRPNNSMLACAGARLGAGHAELG